MAYFLSPTGNSQFVDANGDPLIGGKIHTYLAGSTTPTATYTDNSGATQQANPIILNALGVPNSPIWLGEGISYKFVVKDAGDVTLSGLGGDNIEGVNDAATSASEWVESGFVPTYLSATTFSVPGDKTDTLQVGRRLKTTNTAGLVYSTIAAASFAAGVTGVTVVNDSGTLDAGLSAVSYGLLAYLNQSLPGFTASKATNGYQKLPSGLIMQWGSSVVLLDVGGNGIINYPLTFPTAVYTVTLVNGDVTVHGDKVFSLQPPNTVGFVVSLTPNPGAVSVRVNWTAFGS
jgi:hypothetical protein